jgi:hypothetical protein
VSTRSILRDVAVMASLAVVAGGLPAAAGADETRTVVAAGSAVENVTVAKADRKNNTKIKAAVDAAAAKALPAAVAEAREYAQELATAAGVTLGGLLSITNVPGGGYYGPFGFEEGPFGPGQFCGDERRPVFKRDKKGRRRLTGFHTVHVCRIPPRVYRPVQLTFAIAS